MQFYKKKKIAMHFFPCDWKLNVRLPCHPQALVGRLKENLEKMTEERNQRVAAENREKEQNKRMQRQMRDMKEEMGELSKKEGEASRKKHELVSVCGEGAEGRGSVGCRRALQHVNRRHFTRKWTSRAWRRPIRVCKWT